MHFSSLSVKVFFRSVVISLLPLIIMSEIFLSEFEEQIQRIEFNHLAKMSDKKIEQISTYINERIADVEALSRNPVMVNAIEDIDAAFKNRTSNPVEYQRADHKIRAFAANFLRAGYYDLFLIAPNSDIVFTVLHEVDFATNLIDGPYSNSGLANVSRNVMAALETDVSDFFYYQPSDEAAAFIASPIMKQGKILGVLVAQIDIDRVFEVVTDNVGLGETGETVIARKENNIMSFIGPLKFKETSDSKLAISMDSDLAIPMQNALEGLSGHDFSVDYHGQNVIAVWRYLPVFRWGIVVKKDVKEVFSSVQDMRELSQFVLLSLLLIILVIGYFIGQSIVRPIRKMTQVAKEIAAGDFHQRVKVKSHDEIGQLAKTFNQMTDNLQKSHLNLVNKAEEAERANLAKSDFLSHMSHELRTPLNAILGFAQMLNLDAEEFDDTQQSNVKEILDAGHHLLKLINELLDLTNIESGHIEISMEEVQIDDVLQHSISLIKAQADSRHIKLIDNISGKGYTLNADNTRLKQVLLNLMSNAVKYNQDHGHITLEAKIINKNRLNISIIDTGKGLNQEEITKLFTSFERLDTINNVEGTGIGLVITKHLVELMGGTINVESTPGQGCEFCVEFEMANRHERQIL